MTSLVKTFGVPAFTTRLTSRLRQRLTTLAAGMKARRELADSLPLAPGERVLATTQDSCGRWVAASDRGLYHCEREVKRAPMPVEWIQLGWEEIAKVSWDEELGTLTLSGLLPAVPRSTVLQMHNGGSMSRLVREQIAATAVVNTTLPLGQHGSARVLGRRRPGSGEPVWLVTLDSVRTRNTSDDTQNALKAARSLTYAH